MRFRDKKGNVHDSMIDVFRSNRDINRKCLEVKDILEEPNETDDLNILEKISGNNYHHSPLSIDHCQRVVINYIRNEIVLQDESGKVLRSEKINDVFFKEISLEFLSSFLTDHTNSITTTKNVILASHRIDIQSMKKLYQKHDISGVIYLLARIINHVYVYKPSIAYKDGITLLHMLFLDLYHQIRKK